MSTKRTVTMGLLLAATGIGIGLSIGAAMAEPVTTEAAFRDAIVDKTLSLGPGHVVIHGDGTLSGEFNGNELSGTWRWDRTFFCRTLTSQNGVPEENCQAVAVSGSTATFTANEGTGTVRDWAISD